MQEIPYLKRVQESTTLMVDGQPFLILGGELHNSSGSDLQYMEEHVWPALRQLGGNCYLTPVYWEALEPQRGCYDFALVDGVIEQARREDVRLVLLWFGLWKNGGSSYVPAWMKQDERYFYMQGQDGRLLESVSPFCQEAVDADAAAFTALMAHLRQTDEQRTVIMVQVENEVGVWGHPRDYCPAAEAQFRGEIPAELAQLYGAAGTWEDAFGLRACEYFMAWALARAVEQIASQGKAAYPLPLFMNCVPAGMGVSQLAGSCPSGGPVVRVHEIWRKLAPSIDLYGPDIYTPNFSAIAGAFAASNALVIPELGAGADTAAKALYAAAAYNLVCFSIFGIEGMLSPLSENDFLAQMNMAMPRPAGNGGLLLAESYRLLKLLWPEMRKAQEEKRIYPFLQEGMGSEFVLDDYVVTVQYGNGRPGPGMPPAAGRPEGAVMGGGFILREGADRFLICGLNCAVQVRPRYASRDEQVFILEKREMHCRPEGLTPGRMLNGDERNFLRLGEKPAVQVLQYYRRTR